MKLVSSSSQKHLFVHARSGLVNCLTESVLRPRDFKRTIRMQVVRDVTIITFQYPRSLLIKRAATTVCMYRRTDHRVLKDGQ